MASGVNTFFLFLLLMGMLQYVTCTNVTLHKTTSGQPGGTLSLDCLECSCEISTNIGKINSWFYYRRGQLITNSINCSQSQIETNDESGRVSVNEKSFTLTIYPLQCDDEGHYTCQCYQHVTRYSVTVCGAPAPSLWYIWLIVGVCIPIIISIIIIWYVKTRKKSEDTIRYRMMQYLKR